MGHNELPPKCKILQYLHSVLAPEEIPLGEIKCITFDTEEMRSEKIQTPSDFLRISTKVNSGEITDFLGIYIFCIHAFLHFPKVNIYMKAQYCSKCSFFFVILGPEDGMQICCLQNSAHDDTVAHCDYI